MSKWSGILFVSMIFSVLHVGNLVLRDPVLAFSVGVVFSVVREKTGSIYGITVSHGVINIVLFLIAPYYL
jgi:membrane protease YdiL (CAAX protease family)